MAKHGQAKVLSNDEFDALLREIETHRHPEKNALIMQLSFKLGNVSISSVFDGLAVSKRLMKS